MKKSPPAVVLVRLLAAKGILQRRTYRQAIQHGFGRQNSCLSLVIVVRNPAPKIKPTARASERGQSSVRKSAESLLRLRTSRQRTNCGPVRLKKDSSRTEHPDYFHCWSCHRRSYILEIALSNSTRPPPQLRLCRSRWFASYRSAPAVFARGTPCSPFPCRKAGSIPLQSPSTSRSFLDSTN